MVDPKGNVVSVGPKKGECYICNVSLERAPSIQIQKQIPIIRKMQALGRCCLPCAKKFSEFIQERIAQADRGEYQA